jgi:Uma2 family endonuclease
LTADNYLIAEDGADSRHEYIDGELYAMTGVSDPHGLIVGNISTRCCAQFCVASLANPSPTT